MKRYLTLLLFFSVGCNFNHVLYSKGGEIGLAYQDDEDEKQENSQEENSLPIQAELLSSSDSQFANQTEGNDEDVDDQAQGSKSIDLVGAVVSSTVKNDVTGLMKSRVGAILDAFDPIIQKNNAAIEIADPILGIKNILNNMAARGSDGNILPEDATALKLSLAKLNTVVAGINNPRVMSLSERNNLIRAIKGQYGDNLQDALVAMKKDLYNQLKIIQSNQNVSSIPQDMNDATLDALQKDLDGKIGDVSDKGWFNFLTTSLYINMIDAVSSVAGINVSSSDKRSSFQVG